MLRKKCLILCLIILSATAGFSQTNPADSIPSSGMESLAVDTSLDYDDVMDELGDFLDSILAPRSYFLVTASVSSGYFNYKSNNDRIHTRKQFILSPMLAYFHKSGPGLSLSGNGTKQNQGFTFYQYLLTPSFDFIQNRKWIGGFSYTRYINKDSAEFYVTPLKNEFNAYFLWRKSWLQPGITLGYGWGSREDVKKRETFIKLLRKRKRPLIPIITEINSKESVADFSVNLSLRHSFYWLDLSSNNDYIRFTPMFVLSAGTQKYGFNQSSTSSVNTGVKSGRIEYNRGNIDLDNNTDFQPLSITLYLRPEYSIGKFFIQPQLLLDYYFPGTENNFTVVPSLTAGFMF